MPRHTKTLMLNADWTAIGLIRYEQAIILEVKDRIYHVDFYDGDYVQGVHGKKWPVPAVVALKDYVNPKDRSVPFSRKNVFIRDKMRCQYCGRACHSRELTYDHVIPRSRWDQKKRGTPTTWHNIVSACRDCNSKKADMTVEEAGMKLKREPYVPSPVGYVLGLAPWTTIEKEWIPYIPKAYLKYCREMSGASFDDDEIEIEGQFLEEL